MTHAATKQNIFAYFTHSQSGFPLPFLLLNIN